MDGNFNMGAWKAMENKLADALAAGKQVEVKVDVIYKGEGGWPDGFRAECYVDGVRSVRNFVNKAAG